MSVAARYVSTALFCYCSDGMDGDRHVGPLVLEGNRHVVRQPAVMEGELGAPCSFYADARSTNAASHAALASLLLPCVHLVIRYNSGGRVHQPKVHEPLYETCEKRSLPQSAREEES